MVADDHRFPHPPGQDQHSQLLLGLPAVPLLHHPVQLLLFGLGVSPLKFRTTPTALTRGARSRTPWLGRPSCYRCWPPPRLATSMRGNSRAGPMVIENIGGVTSFLRG